MANNYCSSCGSKIDQTTNYCPNCGESFDKTDRKKYVDVSEISRKKSSVKIGVLILLPFVLLAVAIYFGYKSKSEDRHIEFSVNQNSSYVSTVEVKSKTSDLKPLLIVSSTQVIFAGIKDDIYLTTNGPQYYVKGIVINNGDVDAHNVKLIFRDSGASGSNGMTYIGLGNIKARSSKNFQTDYFQRQNADGSFRECDLSDPVFSCEELGDFPWER